MLCVAVFTKEVFHCFEKEKLPKGAFKLHLCSAERSTLSRMSCCRIVPNTHTLTHTQCVAATSSIEHLHALSQQCAVTHVHVKTSHYLRRSEKADGESNCFGCNLHGVPIFRFQIKTEELRCKTSQQIKVSMNKLVSHLLLLLMLSSLFIQC